MREDLCPISLEIAFKAGFESGEKELMTERDALREALTELCDEIDKHEIHATISQTSISWFKRKARAALAQEQEKRHEGISGL